MHPGVLGTLVLDILMFPVWWYSRGLIALLHGASQALKGYAKYFGIGVWIKNLFVPMFGQRDWQSRLISVFMRLVQIMGRSLSLLVVGLMILVGVVLYVAAPVSLVTLAAYHIFGSLTYAG